MNELDIFSAALELASPDERARFLDQACGDNRELRRRIEILLDSHAQAGSFMGDPAGAQPLQATQDALIQEQVGAVIGPYKLLQQIGEGGMGTVFMAEQTQPVQRKVALKVIKPGMDSRQVVARFEAERQALAMMDHVNIARVFDGGTTANGRPYFVMELVHGVPITRYCDDNHLTPRERLELFVPVCQAIQHAHQKGIIHRDIKPSNVMVTLYDGKPVPKVIDFGVAKATEQKLTEKTLFTQYGALVGTLEYMSPEQAEMSALGVDTRSDIYSLGVLLYELLTGNTPLTHLRMKEAAYAEILRMIKEEEPPKPSTRLSDSGEALASISANRHTEPAKLTKLVRGELDWIVMKTLEKDRNRRYETAKDFAADVQRYLADEPVLACPPSAGYRLRKFARRNKAGLAVAALVLFFLVLLGSGIGWTVRDRSAREAEAAQQQAERQAKVVGQLELIVEEVERLAQQQKWPEALAVAKRAEAVLAGGEADAATAQQVHAWLKDLAFIDRLQQIRMERATVVDGKFNNAGAVRDYALAFREYGVDVGALAVEASIDRLKARPALSIPLAAALDEWVDAERVDSETDAVGWKRLVTVARGIDPEPLRDRLRCTWGRPVSETQNELRLLAESIDVRAHQPATLINFSRTLERVRLTDLALRLLRDAQDTYPGDFWLNFDLGFPLSQKKDYEGAIRFYSAAVAIRPNSAGAHNNLGSALLGQKKLTEAIARYKKAIELDPKNAKAYTNLGVALGDQKKLDEALAAHRKAIELNPKYAAAHNNLGQALRVLKRLDEAIRHCRKAIELDPKFPNPYVGLGDALRVQKKLDEAISHCRKAIELDPKFANAYTGLGHALRDQKKLDEAIAAFDKAIELDPKGADGYNGLGDALSDQGKPDEAIALYRKAIDIDPKSSVAYNNLGNELKAQQKLDEAIRHYRKAIELDSEVAGFHSNLGLALQGQQKLDEAIAAHHKAIELDPNNAQAHNNLGTALQNQEKLPEAITAFCKAIELDSKYARPYSNLGFALVKLKDPKKLPEAVAAAEKAIKLDPNYANAYQVLGLVLTAQQKLDDAIAAFQKAIELDPKLAAAHGNLGKLLWDRQEYDKAIECFRKAVEVGPHEPNVRTNLGIVLEKRSWQLINQAPKLPDTKRAIETIKEAIELDSNSTWAWRYLGWIQYRAGDWRSSIEALEKSCKLQKGGKGSANQWIVLALAHARLAAEEGLPEKERVHHKTEARRWFDQADKIISTWPGRPPDPVAQAIWDFHAEARALLGVKEKKN